MFKHTRKLLVFLIILWQVLWNLAPLFPLDIRPTIDVHSLVAWDKGMFVVLPHEALKHIQNPVLDVFCAIPYTIHVFWPIGFLIYCIWKRRDLCLAYANCFGLLSFFAVVTELVFPTAPPWYYDKYGFAPASYDLKGDPGGLARVDAMFDTSFYLNTFLNSPLVFGAFPSLHCGWPSLLTLFLCFHVFTTWKLRWIPIFYVCWVSFAVVYLQHHYMADVIGGWLGAWCSYELLGPHRSYGGILTKWWGESDKPNQTKSVKQSN